MADNYFDEIETRKNDEWFSKTVYILKESLNYEISTFVIVSKFLDIEPSYGNKYLCLV